MEKQIDLSVIISTYNRCEMLASAIESALTQDAGEVRYEVIVVDNNSTDTTRPTVESLIAHSGKDLRYVFEARQGVSHARNAGIKSARAPIIAFFDDDVCVGRDWVKTIKQTLDEHPEIDCVGGRVLPRWEREPPRWLTRAHWAPVALQDYGEESFHVNMSKPIGFISANFAFRREVFDKIGMFAPELQRVKDGIGSMEDRELMVRFWKAGLQGLYVPGLISRTTITPERLTKAYHRRWHTGHGRCYAMMREDSFEKASARLLDVPAHFYRQTARDAVSWFKHTLMGRGDEAFAHEIQLRFFQGFFRQRREDFLAAGGRGTMREITSFVHNLTTGKSHRGRRPGEVS
jgi:GT2 family glycosyltransferase